RPPRTTLFPYTTRFRPREGAPEDITDEVLASVWEQLGIAHAAGIAHRALTSDVVLLDTSQPEPKVWLTGWEYGDVASSELARRIDRKSTRLNSSHVKIS